MKIFVTGLLIFFLHNSQGQLIQCTIKPGPSANQVDVYMKPDFSNNVQYLFQLQFPMAFPANTTPAPTGLSVTVNPEFTTVFGTYTTKVYALAHNTGSTVNYFVVSMVKSPISAPSKWTAGTEIKVMTVTFQNAAGLKQVKLADFQDGGSDGQGNYYTVNGNGEYYYTTRSIGNFYPVPGLTTVGGDAAEAFALTDLPKGGKN
jgi:hypothetical protein